MLLETDVLQSIIMDKNSGKYRFVTQSNTFVNCLSNFCSHSPISMLFFVMEVKIDIPILILGGGELSRISVGFFAFVNNFYPGLSFAQATSKRRFFSFPDFDNDIICVF